MQKHHLRLLQIPLPSGFNIHAQRLLKTAAAGARTNTPCQSASSSQLLPAEAAAQAPASTERSTSSRLGMRHDRNDIELLTEVEILFESWLRYIKDLLAHSKLPTELLRPFRPWPSYSRRKHVDTCILLPPFHNPSETWDGVPSESADAPHRQLPSIKRWRNLYGRSPTTPVLVLVLVFSRLASLVVHNLVTVLFYIQCLYIPSAKAQPQYCCLSPIQPSSRPLPLSLPDAARHLEYLQR